MYLLDTNHCSRFLGGDEDVVGQVAAHGRRAMATSAVVRGELVFMAHKSERAEANLRRVRAFLDALRIHPVDAATADEFGRMKSAVLDRFGPRERAARRRARIEQFGFSDNDLWIAATAVRHELIAVSADADFTRLGEAVPLRVENWLAPAP